MPSLVSIEVPDRWTRAPVGEFVPLRVLVHRPADQTGAVRILFALPRTPERMIVNTDLLPQDVTVRPGETFALMLHVKFTQAGPADTKEFELQVIPIGRPSSEAVLVALPAHPFRVVPAIDRLVTISVTRICGYEDAVKLEAVVTATGTVTWDEFELTVGPAGRVRSGVTRRREPSLRPGQECAIELVVAGGEIEFGLTGTAQGERTSGTVVVPVPASTDRPPEHTSFVFLEPRSLSTDQILIQEDETGSVVAPVGGVYPVTGNKTRYLLTITPSHEAATDVELYGAAGQVEVEERPAAGKERAFLVTVVDNPTLTQSVRLYYDVVLPGRTLRGELFLSIRPSSLKLWAIAATAGAAVTLKGIAALGPALLRPDTMFDDLATDIGAVFQKRWFDLLQLSSILVVRSALWFVDRVVWRPLQEG